jgi:glycosyltransferase involved in cell wall biosynthesis
MAECYDKAKIKCLLKVRETFGNHRELAEADVLIFHCPLDLIFLDMIDKPSIFYNHRSGRPTTFMFNHIIRLVEPIRREVLKQDREWVNNKLKELLHKPDVILSNSKFTQRMLKKYFGVESFVVYPPIDLNKFKPSMLNPKRDYFLSVQRVNWQKRITVQIEAFRGLNQKLVIVGGLGDKRPNDDLLRLTEDHDNIQVLGEVSDRKLVSLYTNAKATIQTGYYEDFGLVPVESMACGTPVIVVDEGGFKETVHSPKLGIRIKKPYIENLKKAVINFDSDKYDSAVLRKEAEKYGLERFKREMEYYIQLAIRRHNLVERSSKRLHN